MSILDFLSIAMLCATVLSLAFMIVLAMPQSRMRDVMKRVLLAVVCVLYVFSPVDFLPEVMLGPIGLIDDLGAGVLAFTNVRDALKLAA